MARHTFGGDVASMAVNVDTNKSVSALNGGTVTFYTAQTGGSQVTDLLAADDVTPITSVTTGSDGTLPVFYGPDGTTQLWASIPGTSGRRLMCATDVSGTYVPSGTTRSDLGPSVGLDLERSGSGQGNGNKATYFNLAVSADTIAQVNGVNGASGSKVDGLNLIHHFGGSATQGGRNSFEVNLLFDGGATNASNADRNYVALTGQFVASNDDGGTSTVNFKGAGFGGGSWAQAKTQGYWLDNLTSWEFNTLTDPSSTGSQPTGERVRYLSGIQIASENQKRGFTYDCGIALSGLSASHAGFLVGMLIGDMNGGPALAADSTVLRVINHTALTNGFDFTGVTFSGNILKTSGVVLTETQLSLSGMTVTTGATSHHFEFGRQDGVASTPFFDWHSGATLVDYDARLQATGGDGTTGGGALNVNAAQLLINAQRAGATPFTITLAATPTSPAVLIQSSTAAVLMKVSQTGQIVTASGNEATGAGTPLFGSNSPAVTNTAPYRWLKFTTSDGSQVYVPAWK